MKRKKSSLNIKKEEVCTKKLSVIVPVCIKSQNEEYYLDRISYCLSDSEIPKEMIEFIVVEDASSAKYSKIINSKCQEYGITFYKTGRSEENVFSLSKARNFAASRAKGEFLMFLDIDLLPYDGFYKDILNIIEIMDMNTYIDNFFWVPVIYINKKHADCFKVLKYSDKRKSIVYSHYVRNSELIEKYSCGTSVCVVNKLYFHQIGGYNEGFIGWGYEDYEFQTRLIIMNNLFPIPKDWATMEGNFMRIKHYRGWKATYILYGEIVFRYGVFLTHISHPIKVDFKNNKYESYNRRLLMKNLKKLFDVKHPAPIPVTSINTLLVKSSPFTNNIYVRPFYGNTYTIDECLEISGLDENFYRSSDLISKMIAKCKIKLIVFQNPYQNDMTLELYRWCRKNKFDYIVCERGALPGSLFYDSTGFLYDSEMYSEEKWRVSLSDHDLNKIKRYIDSVVMNNLSLEPQSDRIGGRELIKRLGVPAGKKILFVAFQQPHDTVVMHFSKGFEQFMDFVRYISKNIPDDWVLVYKRHPVEKDNYNIPNSIDASHCNIYDLLEAADKVLLINSGVGVLSLFFRKPVYLCGKAFYAHHDLNVDIRELFEKKRYKMAMQIIFSRFNPDISASYQFLYYLVYKFYSFGNQKIVPAIDERGRNISATIDIKMNILRWIDGTSYRYRSGENVIRYGPMLDIFCDDSVSISINTNKSYVFLHKFKMTPQKRKKLKNSPYAFFRDFFINLFSLVRK